MTTLTYLTADETKNFIDSVVEQGLPSTTEHHHHLGAVLIAIDMVCRPNALLCAI